MCWTAFASPATSMRPSIRCAGLRAKASAPKARPWLNASRRCVGHCCAEATARAAMPTRLKALLGSKLATAQEPGCGKRALNTSGSYRSLWWAGGFLDYGCERARRSRLEPMKPVARRLRAHGRFVLNWLRAKGELSSAAVEGLNNKIRVLTRRAYGFHHSVTKDRCKNRPHPRQTRGIVPISLIPDFEEQRGSQSAAGRRTPSASRHGEPAREAAVDSKC